MKKISLIIISALACAGMWSCTDILDQAPLDSYTDDAVFGDLKLSEVYLNDQYTKPYYELNKGIRYSNYTEEMVHKHIYGTNKVTQSLLSVDDYHLGNYEDLWNPWKTYYSNIKALNLFLDKIDGVPAESEDDKEFRDRQKGQALFLRAWNYHLLYAHFGRVVIVDKVHELDDEFNETRSDMDAVADFIVGDLDDAASLLPEQYEDESDYGRVTKGAALALKSRVLLFQASPLFRGGKGNTDKARWQKASDAAKAVIDMGLYSLQELGCSAPTNSDEIIEAAKEYHKLFLDANNPEAIFLKIIDPVNDYHEWNVLAHQLPCGEGNGFEGWGTFDPTQNLVNKIQTYTGEPQPITSNPDLLNFEEGHEVVVTENPWKDLEIRFHANILPDGAMWGYADSRRAVEVWNAADDAARAKWGDGKDSSNGDYWWNASNTGYSLIKFADADFDCYGTLNYAAPFFWIRLAEIYLNYAECQIELGNDAEAFKYINMIRHRALLPDATGDVKAAYRYEREMELMFEGQRFFDTRRWMEMDTEYATRMAGCEVLKYEDGHLEYHLNNPLDQRVWGGDKFYWAPIPREELNRSDKLDADPYTK